MASKFSAKWRKGFIMNVLLGSLEKKIQSLPVNLAVNLPSGKRIGSHSADVNIYIEDMTAVAALATGKMGALGEAVVEGKVLIEGGMRDIMKAVTALLPSTLIDNRPGWWSTQLLKAKSKRLHSKRHDAKQIEFHYDVSDDFYKLWLDPHRAYSCAYYREDGFTLQQAQEAKFDHICRKLNLRENDRFLDIGAGWGGLLIWAVEHYGVNAIGITLSKNQYSYVQSLIKSKGLQSKLKMELKDYRDLDTSEPFDKIASVGMFEHVGRAQLPNYFRKLFDLLRPGGLVLNHGITAGGLDNSQVGGGMGDFIEKYIFPGGELIHASLAHREIAYAGLEAVDIENLRPHYARTLWQWSDQLEAKLDEAEEILTRQSGIEQGNKTLRAYRLYLAGCAIAFEQGWVSLHQILATKPNGSVEGGELPGSQSDYPFRRDRIYE